MSKKTVDKTGDHPPPMRPMTAWTIFNGDKTKELAAEGKRKEAHSLSKQAWENISKKEKAPYVKKAEEDTKRYERQVEELKKKGYFTLGDGSKSTDRKNAQLFRAKKKKNSGDSEELKVAKKPKKSEQKQQVSN